MKRNGFTLVELSIVLVIIGLLIGGILVAQSMIATVKTQNIIREIQQFDVAVSAFQAKYKGLPGNLSAWGCPANEFSVCEDGKIQEGGEGGSDYHQGEIDGFWADLRESGLNYTPSNFDNSTNPSYLPPPSIASDVKNAMVEALWSDNVNTGKSGPPVGLMYNVYQFLDCTGRNVAGQTYFESCAPVFKPVTALAIDKKIDDGKPHSGIVQDIIINTYDQASMSPASAVNCILGSNYKTSNSNAGCYLTIKLLGQTGQDQ